MVYYFIILLRFSPRYTWSSILRASICLSEILFVEEERVVEYLQDFYRIMTVVIGWDKITDSILELESKQGQGHSKVKWLKRLSTF